MKTEKAKINFDFYTTKEIAEKIKQFIDEEVEEEDLMLTGTAGYTFDISNSSCRNWITLKEGKVKVNSIKVKDKWKNLYKDK